MDMDNLQDGIEIPDELLEGIAGGELSDAVKAAIDEAVAELKKRGRSKQTAMYIFSQSENIPPEELLAYIDTIWD